jgi:AAA domain, putative AbiEii toxin, Type IV TA system
MQIQQISVTGLFGIFDHVIPLNMADRITIVHSPNGFGKTAMLRLLNGFFNSRYSVFRKIPFKHFQISLSNGNTVNITRIIDEVNRNQKKEYINFRFCQANLEDLTFDLKTSSTPGESGFPIDSFNAVPDLRLVGGDHWLYTPTRESLSFNDVLDLFEEILPSEVRLREEPKWLGELKHNIHIRFIESQRLLNVSTNFGRVYPGTSSMLPTVSAYSNELSQIMQGKFTEYGAIAQSLDRTFPVRLVQQQPSQTLTIEKLRDRLDRIELTRSSLIDVGLLDRDSSDNSEFQLETPVIDENTKNILSVYVDDVEDKLSVFNDLAIKLGLLRRIINDKFTYKQITFDKKRGFIFITLDSDNLLPTDLSSGEQHELVLLYELLFKVEAKSLVLIDEPELSLHVGWQVNFLKDLQEVTKLADLDILMATHSPDIIQDRWDLTVELQGLKK